MLVGFCRGFVVYKVFWYGVFGFGFEGERSFEVLCVSGPGCCKFEGCEGFLVFESEFSGVFRVLIFGFLGFARRWF